jgi:hypothetical protein
MVRNVRALTRKVQSMTRNGIALDPYVGPMRRELGAVSEDPVAESLRERPRMRTKRPLMRIETALTLVSGPTSGPIRIMTDEQERMTSRG